MTDKAREAIERVRDLSKYPAYKHNNLEQWATELEIDSKTLADEIERLEAEHRETLEVLEDVTNQATYMHREEYLDSLAISANANGLRHLAKYGRVIIDQEAGHRVIAHYPPQEDRDEK